MWNCSLHTNSYKLYGRVLEYAHRFLIIYFFHFVTDLSLITHLANLLRMLGDLLTAICDGDLSISFEFSMLAFSKTWKRDLTFKLESSSSPRSGLSEAEISKKISSYFSLCDSTFCFGGKFVRQDYGDSRRRQSMFNIKFLKVEDEAESR